MRRSTSPWCTARCSDRDDVPTRLHSECLTGDALGSLALRLPRSARGRAASPGRVGRGAASLYLRQEGRGIGLINKVRAYALQDIGLDTVEANLALGFRDDERDYAIAAHMLKSLAIRSVRLMTNNPAKIRQLTQYGLQVSGRIPHVIPSNPYNRFYLETKASRSGHFIDLAGKSRLPNRAIPWSSRGCPPIRKLIAGGVRARLDMISGSVHIDRCFVLIVQILKGMADAREGSLHDVRGCEALPCVPLSIINWVNAGRLPAFRTPGGHRRIRREDLARFMRENGIPLPEELRDGSGRARVLVVDDEAGIRDVIAESLVAARDPLRRHDGRGRVRGGAPGGDLPPGRRAARFAHAGAGRLPGVPHDQG